MFYSNSKIPRKLILNPQLTIYFLCAHLEAGLYVGGDLHFSEAPGAHCVVQLVQAIQHGVAGRRGRALATFRHLKQIK